MQLIVWVKGNHDAIEAVSAALLAVVTVILGWIAFRQFTTTRAQLRAYVFVTATNFEELRPDGRPKN